MLRRAELHLNNYVNISAKELVWIVGINIYLCHKINKITTVFKNTVIAEWKKFLF